MTGFLFNLTFTVLSISWVTIIINELNLVAVESFVLIPTDRTTCWTKKLSSSSSSFSSSVSFWKVPSKRSYREISTQQAVTKSSSNDEEDLLFLSSVGIEEFQNLCRQYGLSVDGTKDEMLIRLRHFAKEQAEEDRQRKLDMLESAKDEGIDVSLTDEDEIDGVFYFNMPGTDNTTATSSSSSTNNNKSDDDENHEKDKEESKSVKMETEEYLKDRKKEVSAEALDKAKKKKVVEIYNTEDTNDLTGFNLQSKPGQAFINSASTLGTAEEGSSPQTLSSYFDGNDKKNKKKNPSYGDNEGGDDFDSAEEQCSLLIQTLLRRVGLSGFLEYHGDELFEDDDEDENDFEQTSQKIFNPEINNDLSNYVPFDPSEVPSQLLEQYTTSLQSFDGSALRSALEKIELNAIGKDGMNADDVSKGGGHYSEVRKVGAFLDGYRVAKDRQHARQVTNTLLDGLVKGGVTELDRLLSSMVQANYINDNFISYLNNLVREQEKKVEREFRERKETAITPTPATATDLPSLSSNINNEEEILDPNQPADLTDALLQEDKLNNEILKEQQKKLDDKTAQEKILIMLQLLRERVKAEAAYFKHVGGPDGLANMGSSSSSSADTDSNSDIQHGSNLRLLAYCIHASSDFEREQLIHQYIGHSIDKMDDFSELVKSSISYADSTSSDLAPRKQKKENSVLNRVILKRIESIVEEKRETQLFQASGQKKVSSSSSSSLGGSDSADGMELSEWN